MRYESNLEAPDLAPAFIAESRPRPDTMGHEGMSDPDFEPECGFLTHDEAAILYHLAKASRGTWLDIGCRTGWTTAHIAAAGCEVLAIDPELGRAAFLDRFRGNMYNVGKLAGEYLAGGVRELEGMTSGEFFHHVRKAPGRLEIQGAMIDGDHMSPNPLLDAIGALELLGEIGILVFHDLLGRPIQEAVEYLAGAGLSYRVFFTPRGMAACWRGNLRIPVHVPDPPVARAVLARLKQDGFKPKGIEL